jgi:lupus La protein
MSDERRDSTAPADSNAEAEKDVQRVLSELKAQEAQNQAEDSPNADNKVDTQKEIVQETNGAAASEEDKEETQTPANPTKEPEARDGPKDGSRPPGRGSRSSRPYHRDNIKSDLTSQKESNDPDAIRKQVS